MVFKVCMMGKLKRDGFRVDAETLLRCAVETMCLVNIACRNNYTFYKPKYAST